MKHHQILAAILLLPILVSTGCSTQRYGRAGEVSSAERQMLNCREIALETAKAEEFLSSVRAQRADTSGTPVLGALGDFGIGNVMEGDAAEASGETRLKALRELKAEKKCSE